MNSNVKASRELSSDWLTGTKLFFSLCRNFQESGNFIFCDAEIVSEDSRKITWESFVFLTCIYFIFLHSNWLFKNNLFVHIAEVFSVWMKKKNQNVGLFWHHAAFRRTESEIELAHDTKQSAIVGKSKWLAFKRIVRHIKCSLPRKQCDNSTFYHLDIAKIGLGTRKPWWPRIHWEKKRKLEKISNENIRATLFIIVKMIWTGTLIFHVILFST